MHTPRKGFMSVPPPFDKVVSLKVDAFCLFKIVLLSKVLAQSDSYANFHCSSQLRHEGRGFLARQNFLQ